MSIDPRCSSRSTAAALQAASAASSVAAMVAVSKMATASTTSIPNGALLLRYPVHQESPSTNVLARATGSIV